MPDDDLLDVAPRRRLPRWVAIVAALAVVGAGIGVLAGRGGGSKQPRAAASPTPSRVTILQRGGTDDLALVGGYLYRLASGALYRDEVVGDQLAPDDVVSLEGLDLTQSGVTYHLVPDPAGRWIYVVSYGESPATVIQVDVRQMVQAGLRYWPAQVSSAAVLDGTLYLAATNAVVAFTPQAGSGRQVGALPGQYQDVVADPSRHRLVLFGFENGQQRFVGWTPATGALVHAAAPFGKGDLAVVGGRIWAGGFGNGGPVLAQLEPRSLRAGTSSPLTGQLGPGAVLVAAGAADLWVRSGNATDDALWCVDGRTGVDLQSWHYTGPVASTTGAAYLGVSTPPYLGASTAPLRLDLRGCRG